MIQMYLTHHGLGMDGWHLVRVEFTLPPPKAQTALSAAFSTARERDQQRTRGNQCSLKLNSRFARCPNYRAVRFSLWYACREMGAGRCSKKQPLRSKRCAETFHVHHHTLNHGNLRTIVELKQAVSIPYSEPQASNKCSIWHHASCKGRAQWFQRLAVHVLSLTCLL